MANVTEEQMQAQLSKINETLFDVIKDKQIKKMQSEKGLLLNSEKVEIGENTVSDKQKKIDYTYKRLTDTLDWAICGEPQPYNFLGKLKWVIEQREKIKTAIQALGTGMPDDEIFYNYYKWIVAGGGSDKPFDDESGESEKGTPSEYNCSFEYETKFTANEMPDVKFTFALSGGESGTQTQIISSSRNEIRDIWANTLFINPGKKALSSLKIKPHSLAFSDGTSHWIMCPSPYTTYTPLMKDFVVDGNLNSRAYFSIKAHYEETYLYNGNEYTNESEVWLSPDTSSYVGGQFGIVPRGATNVSASMSGIEYYIVLGVPRISAGTDVNAPSSPKHLIFSTNISFSDKKDYERTGGNTISMSVNFADTSTIEKYRWPYWNHSSSSPSTSATTFYPTMLYDLSYIRLITETGSGTNYNAVSSYQKSVCQCSDKLYRQTWDYIYDKNNIIKGQSHDRISFQMWGFAASTTTAQFLPSDIETGDVIKPRVTNTVIIDFGYNDSKPETVITPAYVGDTGKGSDGKVQSPEADQATRTEQEAKHESEEITTDTKRQKLIEYALRQVGKPYSTDGDKRTGPDYFDCSGLVYRALQYAGYEASNLNCASLYRKYKSVIKTDYDNMKPGDLVFWNDEWGAWRESSWAANERNLCHHVAIYLGDNMIVEANGSVRKTNIWALGNYYYNQSKHRKWIVCGYASPI